MKSILAIVAAAAILAACSPLAGPSGPTGTVARGAAVGVSGSANADPVERCRYHPDYGREVCYR